MLVSPAVGLWRLRRVRREGLPWAELRQLVDSLAAKCGLRRSVEVLLHEEIAAPLTLGVWRPAIVLPSDAREWSEADLRRALVHELEHVRRGDWPMQLLARATCACYWLTSNMRRSLEPTADRPVAAPHVLQLVNKRAAQVGFAPLTCVGGQDDRRTPRAEVRGAAISSCSKTSTIFEPALGGERSTSCRAAPATAGLRGGDGGAATGQRRATPTSAVLRRSITSEPSLATTGRPARPLQDSTHRRDRRGWTGTSDWGTALEAARESLAGETGTSIVTPGARTAISGSASMVANVVARRRWRTDARRVRPAAPRSTPAPA